MPRIIWSKSSQHDLAGIDAFLCDDNPQAAARMLRAIRATALRLIDYPRIGRAFDEPFRVLGTRSAPYLLIYRIADGNIEIARVRHAREDWLPRPEAEL